MSLIYRIGYYLIGLSVGLIFLTFVFSGKKTSCNYFPSARVKNDMISKKIIIPDEIMNKHDFLNDSLIINYITLGDVDFSLATSDKDSCKSYIFEHKTNSESSTLEIKNCTDSIILVRYN
jgi:hypothetical protein